MGNAREIRRSNTAGSASPSPRSPAPPALPPRPLVDNGSNTTVIETNSPETGKKSSSLFYFFNQDFFLDERANCRKTYMHTLLRCIQMRSRDGIVCTVSFEGHAEQIKLRWHRSRSCFSEREFLLLLLLSFTPFAPLKTERIGSCRIFGFALPPIK